MDSAEWRTFILHSAALLTPPFFLFYFSPFDLLSGLRTEMRWRPQIREQLYSPLGHKRHLGGAIRNPVRLTAVRPGGG